MPKRPLWFARPSPLTRWATCRKFAHTFQCHHLACMQLNPINDTSTELYWSTEIEPEIFAEAIRQGMLISAEGLKKVLSER